MIVRQLNWPARSPDLARSTISYRDILKTKIYATPTELLRRFVTTSRKRLISKKRTVSGRRTGILINCVLVTIFVAKVGW